MEGKGGPSSYSPTVKEDIWSSGERSPDRKMSITLGGKETVDGLLDPESFQGFPKVFYGSRALLKDRHNLEGF
jgi:hypothetical protein